MKICTLTQFCSLENGHEGICLDKYGDSFCSCEKPSDIMYGGHRGECAKCHLNIAYKPDGFYFEFVQKLDKREVK